MEKKKYSIKELKERIKDEKMSAKDYAGHGLNAMARDELKHSFFLSMQLKKKQGR